MSYKFILYIVASFIVGTAGGYKYRETIDTKEDLYPKCLSLGYIQDRIKEGWDINTSMTAVNGGGIWRC